LLGIADAKEQIRMADKIKRENMSVRAVEQMVLKAKAPKNTSEPEKPTTDLHIRTLQEEIQKIVGSKVAVDYTEGKGKIAIHFYSDDELNDIAERIRKLWLN
jgi:ParB family chromosome partitioning protein